MPSLDFIYDLTEKLGEDKIDYIVIALSHQDNDESQAHVFYSLVDERSPEVMLEALDKASADIVDKYLPDTFLEDPEFPEDGLE